MEKEMQKALAKRNVALKLTLDFPEKDLPDLIAFQGACLKKVNRGSNYQKKGGDLQ